MQMLVRRYDTGQPVRLEIVDATIAGITPYAAEDVDCRRLPWAAPGLFDLQVNGHGGVDFSSIDLTPEKVMRIVEAMAAFGVTRFCPTLTTESFEVLKHALATIAVACESSGEVSRRVIGIHLEGPYISAEDGPRGAHPRVHCRCPDWDEFQRLQEAAGGRIRMLTLGAEFAEAPTFIERVAETGVVVAIGHTAANSTEIRAAVDAGARMSTHLGNGSHPMIRRHANYIWDQLAEDRLMAGLIVDGHHLPPEVVKTFVRAKTPARCILVSDMVGLAGSPPGRYSTDLGEVEVLASGRLVVAGQRDLLAGASLPLGSGVANVMQFAGVGLKQAIDMAVTHPARLLGVHPGGLDPENPADLVLFDLSDQFEVRATIAGGRCVFGTVGCAIGTTRPPRKVVSDR